MTGSEVNRSRLVRKLNEVGLTASQASIYLVLVKSTGLRINELTKLVGLPRSSIYEHLRGLIASALVEETVQENHKVYFAASLEMLDHRLRERQEDLSRQREQIQTLSSQLDHWRSSELVDPTVVRYYRGISGARQIFWNTLKSRDTLNVYSEWGRGRYLGIEFYKRFVAESYERGFKERVITNPKTETLQSIKEHLHSPVSRTELDNIRTLETDKLKLKGETLMYDDIYAQVYLKDEIITGFEIQSRHFVKTQRQIFDLLWDIATPVQGLP